jgi:DNA mismatch endonuclease (patch repair protein)
MDVLTPKQRHKCMSNIKSKNTSIEVLLRKALWCKGIRYRKGYDKLPGKPDIAITKYKIAIFCDGELWHGKDWENKKNKIKTNSNYWISKIERNIARDIENEKKLERMGWTVVRFWGKDINKKLTDCVNQIMETIYEVENNLFRLEYEQENNNVDNLMAAEEESVYNNIDN